MPGIGEILAEREARRLQRKQKEHLQQIKLAVLAQQQKGASSNADGDNSDDDELDVVPDTMHSVAREEAAARAAAGRTRPSAGRTTQLRLARVPASPQRDAALPLIPAPSDSPEKRMAAAAQPAFLPSLSRRSGAAAGRGKRSAGMTKAELERMVLRSAEAQSEQLRREKEDEWVRRGGRVVGVMEAVGEEKVQELIGKALEHSEGTHARSDGNGDEDAGSDDDDDDADYVPIEKGSASPQTQGGDDEEVQMTTETNDLDDEDDEDAITEAAIAAMATEVDSETENSAPHPRAARHRRAIIGSDDEDGPSARDDDGPGVPLSLPDLPSPAFTTSPWPSLNPDPDHDPSHENDPYVSGNETDKENRAVVRLEVSGPVPTHGARVLFNDILSARAGTKAAAQPLPLLQPSMLPADDDPFVFTPSPVKAREEALRRLASPTPMHLTGKRGLSQMFEEEADDCPPVPALVIQDGDNDGATLNDADRGLVGFKPVLGGLSQAFEQTQEASGSGSGIGGLSVLRRGAGAEFSLTFEAQAAALQPALEVDDRLRARAAAIFEKEQEYVIEAAQVAPSRAPRRELYITENGCEFTFIFWLSHPLTGRLAHRFLTQTRPDGSSPLVYRPSPSQRPYDALLRSQSDGALGEATGTQASASRPLAPRQPLSTLAETSPTSSSVRREPLRRLRRAHTSPDGPAPASERRYGYSRGPSLSPSPSPSRAKTKSAAVRTAFTELMMAGAAAQRDQENAKKRSEFVEDQAVESDEDDMLGFGGMRKNKAGNDDEDEDDERDEDGVVKALVDDAHMDDAALAKAKVLEKHLEHQTADDARLEKEVQDVVAGKRRTRRHGGAGGLLGSDESEDEEDEEARALRQRLAKKRRVAGDTLDALARNPATASFHATYQMALVDDAEEFAHLDREQDVVPDRDRDRERGEDEGGEGEGGGWDRGEGDGRERGVEGGEDEDEDEDVEMAGPSRSESEKREISAAEVRKALQEVARGEREYRALDPEDVSWMDQDQIEADEAETGHMRVRIASSTDKAPPHRVHLPPADADMDVLSLVRLPSQPLPLSLSLLNSPQCGYCNYRIISTPTNSNLMRRTRNV
ncbi:hypothetical protein BC827DRAFT_870099 [Russula dissimulans]|nr:hypothetical protein BC827DRAFT_870099 [Russula dissimulans]